MRIREKIVKHMGHICLLLAACMLGCVPSYAATTYETSGSESYSVKSASNEANISLASETSSSVAYWMHSGTDVDTPIFSAIAKKRDVTKFQRNTTISETDLQTKIDAGTAVRLDADADNASAAYKIYGWIDSDGTLNWWSNAAKTKLPPDGYSLFQYLQNCTSISLDGIDTSDVTDMSEMFYGDSALTELDVSKIDTSSAINMKSMFEGCEQLTSLNLSNFDTSKVVDMSYMFNDCYYLTSLNVSSFDTRNVTNMSYMFSGLKKLTALNVSNFNTSKVQNMNYMFAASYGLTSLDLSKFDTSAVTNMIGMINNCTTLTSIDVSSFNTSKITDMSYMFAGCGALKDLDLSSFDTSNVTNMKAMFSIDSTLKSVNLSSFDTKNVTDMYSMFYKCSSLSSLDLSSFDTSKVADAGYMFRRCTNLEKIYISGLWNISENEGCESDYMFDSDENLPNFNSSYVDKTRAYAGGDGYLTSVETDVAYWGNNIYYQYGYNDPDYTSVLKLVTGDTGTSVDNVKGFQRNTTISDADLKAKISAGTAVRLDNNSNADYKIYGWLDSDNVLNWWSNATTTYMTDRSNRLFYRLGDCTNISLEGIDTSKMTDMSYMFYRDSNLTSLDLSGLDTSNVTDMSYMFYNCYYLPELDLSSFNTGKVTNMAYMFTKCGKATKINFSSFDTSQVTNMDSMFYETPSLEELDLSSFDTGKVTDMSSMFSGCGAKFINLSSFDTGNVTDMGGMFYYSEAETLDLSSFDTSKVTNMKGMFHACKKLTALDVSNFDTSSVTNMNCMFFDCGALTELDLTSFDTSKVTDMGGMFWAYKTTGILKRIYASSLWSTASVTSSSYMFGSQTNLPNFDSNYTDKTRAYVGDDGYLSAYGTAYFADNALDLVQTGATKFAHDTSTTYVQMQEKIAAGTAVRIDSDKDNDDALSRIYGWAENGTIYWWANTEDVKLKNATTMFKGNTTLTSISLEDIDTSEMTSMDGLFSRCTALTEVLGIEDIDTSSVNNMTQVFFFCSSLKSLDLSKWDTTKVTSMNTMFSACSSLTTLDVSGFKTDKVTNMCGMFSGCSGLTTLDVSGFKTDNVTNMSSMFNGCSGLTTLDVSGFKTDKVTNISSMFHSCSKVTSLKVSGFKTSNATNMAFMFFNCSSLTALDVSGFNTANVTSMSYMFGNCSKITTINVSGFNTAKATNMSGMFSGCSGLTTLNVSNFVTTSATNMGAMFYGIKKVPSLDLSNFNTAKVTNMQNMFYGCSALQTLKLTNFDTSAVTSKTSMFTGNTKLSSLTIGAKTNLSGTSLPSPYAEKGGTSKWTLADQYNHDDACTAAELMAKTASTGGAAGTWVAELADPTAKIKITFTDTTTAKNGLDGTFAIYSSNKEPLYCTTDAEGNSSYVITVKDGSSDEIESDLFVEGNYYLVQLSAPTGFAKSPDQAFTIASTDLGTTKTLAVTNTKQITMPQTGSDEAAKAMQLAALLIIAGVAVLAAGNRSTGRKS